MSFVHGIEYVREIRRESEELLRSNANQNVMWGSHFDKDAVNDLYEKSQKIVIASGVSGELNYSLDKIKDSLRSLRDTASPDKQFINRKLRSIIESAEYLITSDKVSVQAFGLFD